MLEDLYNIFVIAQECLGEREREKAHDIPQASSSPAWCKDVLASKMPLYLKLVIYMFLDDYMPLSLFEE